MRRHGTAECADPLVPSPVQWDDDVASPTYASHSAAREDQQMNALLQLFLQVDGDDDQELHDPASLDSRPYELRGALKRLRGQAGGGQEDARAVVTSQSWSAAVTTTAPSPLTVAHDLHLYAIT